MSEPKTTTDWVRALMKDGNPRSAAQVAETLGARPKFVRDVLSRWVDAGHAHVSGYVGANHAKVFRYGPGVNAPMPLLDTKKARQKREKVAQWRDARRGQDAASDPWREPKQRFTDEELDRRHRLPATWWPAADAVVSGAFDAMIRVEGLAHG
jgi:hypothetical protein